MLRDADEWADTVTRARALCTCDDMGSCSCGSVAGDDKEEYDDDRTDDYDDYPTAGTGGW